MASTQFYLDPSDAKKLRGGRLLYTISLRKSWSKKATYWIGLFKTEVGAIKFFTVVRSWKWPKDGKSVEGSVMGQRHVARNVALEQVKETLDNLILHKGYKIENIVGSSFDLTSEESKWFSKITAGHLDQTNSEVLVEFDVDGDAEQPETAEPESKFDELQKKRRKKAYW